MKKINYIAAIFTLIFLFASCRTVNIYPPSEDIGLGNKIRKEIESDKRVYPILKNKDATGYVQDIVNTILTSGLIEYKSIFNYEVFIIDEDSVVNAFATPGGYIYVYTGLIKLLDNEASLAAVLAHEIAHAERRHTTYRMTNKEGANALVKLLSEETKEEEVKIAGNLFKGLAFMNNSRDDESDADIFSFKYLHSIGKWYPGAMKYFLEKVLYAQNNSGLQTLLSSHPMGNDRVDKINSMLKQYNVPPPTEKNLLSREYVAFKMKLK